MRCLFKFGTTLQKVKQFHVSCRWLLSDSYYCEDAWKARMKCPILQKVNLNEYIMKINSKFETEGAASSVDMEILANTLDQIQMQQVDFAQTLFEKHRKTKACLSMSESLPHALVRALLDMGEEERLLQIVQDKIKYGIFLDDFCANMLMDHFIKRKQYKEAASIAFDLMLQEDFGSELTKALCLYACHFYWKNPPKPLEEPEEPVAEEEEDEYVRVEFLSNPYYDDHFDIPKDSMKLGKTFVMLMEGRNDIVAKSYSLIGWAYYEKFAEGLQLLEEILNNEALAVAREAIVTFGDILENLSTKEPPETEIELGRRRLEDVYPYTTQEQKDSYSQQLKEFVSKLESKGRIKDYDLQEEVVKFTQKAIEDNTQKDIKTQTELFSKWMNDRDESLKQQLLNYKIYERKKAIAERLLELQRKEEKLSYFEQQERIEIGISRIPKHKLLEDVIEEEQYVLGPMERSK